MPGPRRGRRRARRALPIAVVGVVVALAAGAVFVVTGFGGRHDATLATSGVRDGALLGAQALKSDALMVDPAGIKPGSVTATVDGTTVPVLSRGGSPAVAVAGLTQGRHTLAVKAKQAKGGTARATVHVIVDTTPPVASVTVPTARVAITDPVKITGTLDDVADSVRAPGGTVSTEGTRFTVAYPTPPAGAVITVADKAGNTTAKTVTVATTYPNSVRAVHVTGAAWSYGPLRNPVLQMLREHRINAIELDIKDEEGIVNFDVPSVPLAKADGAVDAYYDPAKVAAQLHGMGARLIGRVVAFNDTKLANYAWTHGHRDWNIQNPDGSQYVYGYARAHFTNFANPNVVAYNIDISKAAVKAGFDDVIYDYIRRPDGPVGSERFPGLPTGPGAEAAAEKSVAAFAQQAQAALRPMGGSVGAAIFAQASTRPADTAQNVPLMAKYLDVVVPMDYPSHWNPGEYNVPDPYADPRAIVARSLKDWQKDVQGTACVVVPWLQDENYKGDYTAAKVEAQIQGASDNGIPGWLMWSAGTTYTPSAFTPDAPKVYRARA